MKTKANTLTIEMIDNDGYGCNLGPRYTRASERVIRYKTEDYNRLSGENNDPEKLLRSFRRRTLGWRRTIILDLLAWRYQTLARIATRVRHASDRYYRRYAQKDKAYQSWKKDD